MLCFGFPSSRSTLTYWKESLGAQDVQGEADRTGLVQPEDENKGGIHCFKLPTGNVQRK